MASVGVHVAASSHLQGSRVVLHLRQPLSDLAVGHGAAQGVVGRLQKLQLLLVLSQGLRVAAWAGGAGFSLAGQWARDREGQWGSGRSALRKGTPPARPPAPRVLPAPRSQARTPPHAPWLARSSPSWWQTAASSRSCPLLWALALALLNSAERRTREAWVLSLSAREGQARPRPPRSGASPWTHGEARGPSSYSGRRAGGSGLPAL